MNDIKKLFGNFEKVVFVFPHFDDCAFVSSGLIQTLKELGVKIKVVVFFEDNPKVAMSEYKYYSEYLGIQDAEMVKSSHESLKSDLIREFKSTKPDAVVTFDPGGITGNSHHTLISLKTYEILQSWKGERPKLFWRVADKEEEKFFGKMPEPIFRKYTKLININLNLTQSYKKIKSILMNKSAMKGFMHKLRVIEWYLFDHKEIYYIVNFTTDHLQVNYLKPTSIVD